MCGDMTDTKTESKLYVYCDASLGTTEHIVANADQPKWESVHVWFQTDCFAYLKYTAQSWFISFWLSARDVEIQVIAHGYIKSSWREAT